MDLVIVFGLPAAGKTFVGELLAKHFGYYFYDGDQNLPEEMQSAIAKKEPFSDQMRDRFFDSLLDTTIKLASKRAKLVIAQTFIKTKYRRQFITRFPQVRWILINTPQPIREARLKQRHEYPLDINYARQMVDNFDPVTFPHQVINNTIDGEAGLLRQLKSIFKPA